MANSNNSIRNLSAFEQIDQRFAQGRLTAVLEYIDSLSFPVNITNSGDPYVPERPENERTALYQNSGVYLDSGDGRVSKGLRGLELLSKLCKGINPADLFMFNNVIYSSDARTVKKANREELIQIVIDNLGMTFIVQNAETIAPEEVEKFRLLSYTIGYEVRSGTFRQETYKNRVLLAAKRLAIANARSGTAIRDPQVRVVPPPSSTPVPPAPSSTPSPTPTPSVTVSATPTITPTVTRTVTPTVTATLTATPTVTPTVSVTRSGTPVPPTPTVTPTFTPTFTPSATALPPTPSPTGTPAVSITPTVTPTSTPSIDPFIDDRRSIMNLNVDLTDAKGHEWFAQGDAAVSGGWLQLDGTTDCLITNSNTDFGIGLEDFAIEAWVNISGTPTDHYTIINRWTDALGTQWYLGLNSLRQPVFYYSDFTPHYPAYTLSTVTVGVDTHIVAYRTGGNLYIALNGVVQDMGANTANINTGGTINMTIGAQTEGTKHFLVGSVRGVRVTIGSSGEYTPSNFTPPTVPLPT